MSIIKFIKKSLAGVEDLFFGEGSTVQSRNGGNYVINGIRGFWPVNSQEEFDNVDPNKHPKVVFVADGQAHFYQYDGNVYQQIIVGSSATANDAFTSIVFKRAATKPDKPNNNEGSYASPVPNGWSDGVPAGTGALWSTTRTFSKSGGYPQSPTWSDVAKIADTETTDYEWSSVDANPGNPTSNPDNWSDTPTPSAYWMAVRQITNGVPGAWKIVRIKGEAGANGSNGTNGSRGAGRYYADTLPAPYTWLAGDAAANSAANAACPGGIPVEGDTVTLFKPGDRKVSVSKLFSSGIWVAFAQVIPGNQLVEGTVVADTVRAGAIFGQDATFAGTVYAENLEGDIAEFTALLSMTTTWNDAEVGEKVIRTFSVGAATFARTLYIPVINAEGLGGFSFYIRKSNGGTDPLTWPVLTNSGSSRLYGTQSGKFSSAAAFSVPAGPATRYAITLVRSSILEAATGAAIHTQQQLTLGVFKQGSTITA